MWSFWLIQLIPDLGSIDVLMKLKKIAVGSVDDQLFNEAKDELSQDFKKVDIYSTVMILIIMTVFIHEMTLLTFLKQIS